MCCRLNIQFQDMYNAYVSCRKNKRNKPSCKKFEVNALYNIQKLCSDINSSSYKLRPAECFIVKDPRLREVSCANFRDRVVQHFVYNELNLAIKKMLIYDAANCRKGKGTDFANLQKTLSIIVRYLPKLNLSINHDKTIITEVKYGINYLGVIIRPYYKCLSKRHIKRLYNRSNCFNDVYGAYKSCASRQGMLKRYKGYSLMRKWYWSFPEHIREYLKIQSGFDYVVFDRKKSELQKVSCALCKIFSIFHAAQLVSPFHKAEIGENLYLNAYGTTKGDFWIWF